MSLKTFKPTTPGTRHKTVLDFSGLTKKRPEKKLTKANKRKAGRNSAGKITTRHRGGGEKRLYRMIDFLQNKKDIQATVSALEYDPNRTAAIALLVYKDGEKRYILAPEGLSQKDTVIVSENAELKTGNRMPLKKIPAGMPIHNIELKPTKGGKIVKSAGTQAIIQSKEGKYVIIKMPSSEIRRVPEDCWASLGQVSNPDWRHVVLGKAGRKRHLGIRPTVRGVAMHPGAHPHGGGEGRSGIGMPSPKSPWGKPVGGTRTRNKKKYSNKLIIKRRK